MERYDSYKDSGVEWIGEIPSKWEWLKIKNLFSFSKGTGISKSDIEEDGKSNCILYGELFTRFKDFNVIPNEFSKTNLEDKIVSEGDELLIPGSTTTTSVDLCNCKTLNHKGIQLGGDIIILKPRRNDIYNEFYSYYISTVTKPDFETGGRGVTIHHIYPKQIREIHIPYIPLSEQKQIVSFLDTKTSLIDSLIEKTQRKIELLKEKRTSLINEVVTKGLNSNVEMKDSGVEWIGEIPSGWKYGKVKFFVDYKKGYPFKSENMSDEGLPIIKVTSIKKLKINNPKTYFKGELDDRITVVKEGDIIITTVGSKHEVSNSSVGQLGLVEKDQNGFLLNQNTVSIRTRFNSTIYNKFIFKYFQSKEFRNYLDIHSHGTVNQSSLNVDDILNFNIPYPSLSEQQQIVEYLDEQTQLIDKTISIEEKRIELLKEYRQSLISEVVTGKRKVVE